MSCPSFVHRLSIVYTRPCKAALNMLVAVASTMWPGSAFHASITRLEKKSQVVSLQTAHSWANAGVLLGDACIGSGVAFEAI